MNGQPSQAPSLSACTTLYSISKFSPGQVHYDLTHLSPRKSTSANHMIPILRSMAGLLCESLSFLFNLSLSTSCFPNSWKLASVTPLYKGKGSASSPTNYRPISLLHPVSRLFEYRIALSLSSFLHRNKLISPSQFAYVPQRSATDQLILLTHQMARISDKHNRYDCAFLDFRKAFDKVHHPTLIERLSAFMTRNSVKWFECYLNQRTIAVKIKETISPQYLLNCGVPQGSHLAPLLFLTYINTLPDTLTHSAPYLFADDVTLLNTHNIGLPVGENLANFQLDLTSCQRWARGIHGEFSAAKTTMFSNYAPPPSSSVQMDNVPLNVKSTVIHLGVEISTNLKFQDHFTTVFKKFRQRVNLLCFMGRHLSHAHIALLYKSYVRPTVEYAIPVWCFRLTASQLESLDTLQAKICRCLLRSAKIDFDRYESKNNLNRLCNLESLHFRRTCISITVLFKYIHWHPDYLSRFDINISSSARRPNKLIFNSHGRISSSLFLHKIGKLWNCLPPRLTSQDSLSKFQQQYRLHVKSVKLDCSGISLDI